MTGLAFQSAQRHARRLAVQLLRQRREVQGELQLVPGLVFLEQGLDAIRAGVLVVRDVAPALAVEVVPIDAAAHDGDGSRSVDPVFAVALEGRLRACEQPLCVILLDSESLEVCAECQAQLLGPKAGTKVQLREPLPEHAVNDLAHGVALGVPAR